MSESNKTSPTWYPVNPQRHAHLRWLPPAHQHDAGRAFAPLTLDELQAAVAALPIAFMAQDGSFAPVAVMGLHDGHNLYAGQDGKWHADYRPAALRLPPFQAMTAVDGQRVVCVDEQSSLLTRGSEGESFFDSSGTPSAALAGIVEALAEWDAAQARTVLACIELQRHGLFAPWEIDIPSPVGAQRLRGLFRIDEAALHGLSATALASLHASGALDLAHAQRFSMAQLKRLAERLLQPELPLQPNPHQLAVAQTYRSSGKRVLLVTHEWSTLVEMSAVVKQAGCVVDVLCPANSTTIRNGFYDGWIDSGPTLDTLLLALVQLVAQRSYDEIVIGDDPILWAILLRPIEALYPLLPIARPEAWRMVSKVGFCRHCADHGITTPAFYVVEEPEDVPRALDALGLPLVLKANYSNGGHGVKIIRDEATYRQYWSTHQFGQALLAEAFIDGQLLPVEALFKHGRVLEYAVSMDTAETLGPSTQRRYLPHTPELSDSIARLGNSAGLHGFSNMAYIRETGSGRYYLIEADMRPNKWIALCKWFGHDFTAAFRRFVAEENMPEEPVAALPANACLEIEYFPVYAQKLLNEGRLMDTVLHLLDFDRTWRYVLYDPVQLESRMLAFRQGVLAALRPEPDKTGTP